MHYVSLFSGAGGLDLGAKALGLKPVFVTDIDQDSIKSVRQGLGFPEGSFACEDIKVLLSGRYLQDWLNSFQVDLIIGGPPCHGFSVAGYMDPEDPRSEMVFRFMDAVAQIRPSGFLMENVAALGRKRWKFVLERLRRRADRLGYDTHIMILDAQGWGVPQRRERFFLLGMPRGCRPVLPSWDFPEYTVRDVIESASLRSDDDVPCNAKITLAKKPILRPSPYGGMLVNGGGRVMDLDTVSPTLPATMGGNRTPIIDLNALEHGDEPWIEGYHADLIAGEPPLAKLPDHVRMRRLSLREAAAIQGFPSNYPFQGRLASKWRQIGNAVPPGLAEVALTALVDGMY